MPDNNNYPPVVGPIAADMIRHGPLTRAQLYSRIRTKDKSATLCQWVQAGWLARLDDGRFGPGAKAASLSTRPMVSGLRLKDETGVVGSDQHYILGQLAHGPMFETDLAYLLDVKVGRAQETLRTMAKLGYVRNIRGGRWELVRRQEAAE